MPVSPARLAAFTILLDTTAGRAFAVARMEGPEFSRLPEADRALGTELVMGVLRRQEELDAEIERLSGRRAATLDPEVAIALRLGIYQMRFLERIPAFAAVNESVQLVKLARKNSAAPLVNAVLRRLARSRDVPPPAVNVPPWLSDRWEKHFGTGAAQAIAAASASRPPTCLRVGGVTSLGDVEEELREDGCQTTRGGFAPRALIVASGNVKKSRAWQEGRVVIQDQASQLVAELVAPRPGSRLLDLCAAPGMKMMQMAEAMGEGSLLACDSSAARLKTLERLTAPRLPPGVKLTVQQVDAASEAPAGGPFDWVLVDAPCSGTGTLARHPEIKSRLKPEDLTRLHRIQTKILRNALAVLASGGRLVYATCSLEPEENGQVLEEVLEGLPGFRLLTAPELAAAFPHLAPFFEEPGYFATLPASGATQRLDGFFAAAIVRTA